jgi:RNA polymerase sigma-70 factor (ECF subfamily)
MNPSLRQPDRAPQSPPSASLEDRLQEVVQKWRGFEIHESSMCIDILQLLHGRLESYLRCVCCTVDDDVVEDLVQDFALQLYSKALEMYDPKQPLMPFLWTIARNVKITYLRKIRDTQQLMVDLPDPSSLEKGVTTRILCERLLARLSDDDRDIMYLYYVEEHTLSEVAKIVDQRETKVRGRIQRFREECRKHFEL